MFSDIGKTLLDTRVLVNPLMPEFSPRLCMAPCGCSEEALQSMNDWLLKRFGRTRTAYWIDGTMCVHPNTFEWIKRSIGER